MKNPADCCRNSKGLQQIFKPVSFLFCFALFLFAALPWNSAMAQTEQCDLDSECTNDGNACTIEYCYFYDPPLPFGKRGICNRIPRSCADNDPCTYDHPCDPFRGCGNTQLGCACAGAVCNDNNSCTDDVCHLETRLLPIADPGGGGGTIISFQVGTCQYNPKPCPDDNNACTIEGVCDYFTQACAFPTFVSCDDGNPCTTDFCNSVSGCLNGTFCPDFNECTEDICTDSGCVHIPIVCDDGSSCTSEVCNPLTGCVYELCDDHDICTNDHCDNGNCIHEDRCPDNSLCYSISFCNTTTGNCTFNGLKICANTNLCTDEACDPATGECATIKECNSPECCDDGTLCTEDICFNGLCLHPIIICTGDANACTNDFCLDGLCVHPSICDDHDPCTNDLCDGDLDCTYTDKICNDNNPCTSDACAPDSVDGCAYTLIPDCCASLDCNDGDTCTIDFCDQLSGCLHVPRNCSDNIACTDDICTAIGTCSNTPKDCDDHTVCTVDDPCINGMCPHTPVNCADTDLCTQDGCDPITGCYNHPWCVDDGDPCTIDTCIRICDPTNCILCPIFGEPYCTNCNNCANGPPTCFTLPKCIDNDACTDDYCDFGVCSYPPTVCNDGDACTDDICNPSTGCSSTPKNCDDGILCTTDHCDENTGCTNTVVTFPGCCETVANCDDGNPCSQEFCTDFSCRYLPTCPESDDRCITSICDEGFCYTLPVNCEDFEVCTQDFCDLGACYNIPVTCDDQIYCTHDMCDPASGCVHSPYCQDDGDPCTRDSCGYECDIDCALCGIVGQPFCSRCNTCLDNPPVCIRVPKCDDGDACTTDECDGNGNCSYTPVNCDDGNACTDDSCAPATGCSSTLKDCDDGNACTSDGCNNGACSNLEGLLVGYSCESDGNACTADVCGYNTCMHNYTCGDNDACTTDGCDPSTGCTHTPVNCDDGNACTFDYCDDATGCVYQTVICDDGNLCTEDRCQPSTGCSNPAIICIDDGNACTFDECNGGVCTHPANNGAICNNDGNECTLDVCSNGGCTHQPLHEINCTPDDVTCTIDFCSNGICTHDSSNCPVDCVVSDWSAWGNCSASCGGGQQCRTRTILVRNANGGAECPDLQECRACNTQSCDPCNGVPARSVKALTLVYEHTVGVVGPLTNGKVIDKDTLCRFNIRADVCPTIIGSVKFQLTGTQTLTKTETVAPYALFGDSPPGDYNPWSPPTGNYTLKVTGYSGPNATGTAGTPLTIQFSVVDGSGSTATNCARPQINCTALNCDDGNACTTNDCHPSIGCVYTAINCNDGNVCTSDACVLGTCQYSSISCNDNNGCTIDICNTATGCQYTAKNCNDFNACTTDGCNPSTGACTNNPITCNDNKACTIDNCNPSAGCTYTPTASCCTLNTDCNDNVLCTVDACNGGVCNNTVVGQRVVTSFTLVNSANETDIGPIDNGSVINLAVTPNINIRANLCTNTGTKSMRFKVNANNNFRTENDVPYALVGDAPPGDYHKWNVTPGTYTITATPYAGSGATSTVGTPKTITITIVNNPAKMDAEESRVAMAEEKEVTLAAYPNPFSDKLNIEFSIPENSKVKLEIFNVTGQRLATLFEGDATKGELKQIEYDPAMNCDCMIIYRLQTSQGTYYGKAVMVK